MSDVEVLLEPWSEGDLGLLRRLNAPEMTEHLGGPETEAKVVERHERGLAVAAGRQLVELARADGRHRWLHAFPSVDNPPSNAICRKLGFTLLGPCDFEYPTGRAMTCHDWRLELTPPG